MSQQTMLVREVAHRLFATELNDAREEIKDDDPRAPSYVLTPTGAKVNRLFLVGVLTDCENIGQDGNELWRARISDPTGVFTVYAGQYQPEAAQALSEMEIPSFVAVVGKARTYEPEPGSIFISVRPESVTKVDAETRDRWVLEAGQQCMERLGAWSMLLAGEANDQEGLERAGVPTLFAEGAHLARSTYGDLDLTKYAQAVTETMDTLAGGGDMPVHEVETTPSGTPTGQFKQPSSDADLGAPTNEELENLIKSTVEQMLSENPDGAIWDDVVEAAGAAGHSEDDVEEVLNDLMDKGIIYEPVLGKLKMT